MSKERADKKIQVGGSPKALLQKRGLKYDGSGFLPQVPDYLGYVLGVMLLWLLYTGYSSVVSVFSSPDSPVVHLSDKAKDITKKTKQVLKATTTSVQKPSATKDGGTFEDFEGDSRTARARLSDSPTTSGSKKGWGTRTLERLNKGLNNLSSEVADSLSGMFSDDEHEGSYSTGRTILRGDPEEETEAGSGRLDTLDSF